MLEGRALVIALITCICSFLSLGGSLLIILSYFIARSKSTPKTAFLILHLATSDFLWFLAASVMSTIWLTNDGNVPDGVCYIAAPVIVFARMASLIWTCVVSFNVLMSVRKRKWFWKNQEEDWETYRKFYFAIIFLFAAPSTLLTMVSQYTAKAGEPLGCAPLSESLGAWYIIIFTEMVPIFLAFCFNMFVFFMVRDKMTKSAVPQSVRNKRKRVMYHYIVVCILCWIPMIVLEFFQVERLEPFALDVFARVALYLSGFLNFLVFGMQDPHLKRSMEVVMYRLGLGSLAESLGISTVALRAELKSGDVEKNVMFQEETLISNADLSKDRFSIYRNRKLSKDDKKDLYEQRPDLDPKFRTFGPSDKGKSGGKGKAISGTAPRKSALKNSTAPAPSAAVPVPTYRLRSSDCSDDLQLEAPLLSSYRESFNAAAAGSAGTNVQNPMQNSPNSTNGLSTSPPRGVQMRAMSNDSQQSLTSHDVTTLSNLALTGAELLTATNDEGVERTSDVEAQEEDALVSNDGASSDEESSDDEIDEEDEYLMQPPSQ
eukprot:gene14355-10254_t